MGFGFVSHTSGFVYANLINLGETDQGNASNTTLYRSYTFKEYEHLLAYIKLTSLTSSSFYFFPPFITTIPAVSTSHLSQSAVASINPSILAAYITHT